MCSSAWSGGASSETGDRTPHGPPVPDRSQPAGRRGSFLSEDRRREPGALVHLLLGPPSLARHRRIRSHLPVVWESVLRGGRVQSHGANHNLLVQAPPCILLCTCI